MLAERRRDGRTRSACDGRTDKTWRRLCGPDRAALYTVAAYTGFRVRKLANLTTASFSLDADPPTATVTAGTASGGGKTCNLPA